MSHLEQLDAAIATAKAELDIARAEFDKLNADIQSAVRQKKPEPEIEQLQTERDSCARKLERLSLALQGLEATRPEMARRDARALLPSMEKAIATHVKRLSECYGKLEDSWHAFITALEACAATQRDCADVDILRCELLTLCAQHDIDPPTLSTVPEFPVHLVPAVRQEGYEKVNRMGVWEPHVKKATHEALTAGRHAQNRRRVEEWMALPPAQRRGFPPKDVLRAMTVEEQERCFNLPPRRPARPPSGPAGASVQFS